MKISIRSGNLEDETIRVFEKVVEFASSLEKIQVDEIIVSDSDRLEENIRKFNQSVSLTNIFGGQVRGKTINHDGRNIIFLITDIVTAIGNDLVVEANKNIVFSEIGIQALKTLFHEFGHANINQEYGELRPITNAENYYEFLNEHWKILRDEFLAEMFCANIYRFIPSYEWYGEFNDEIEENNFREYAKEYKTSQELFDWNLAFRLLHQYYFIPLFYKAGFLEGMKRFIKLDGIPICETIAKIMNLRVIQNANVTQEFNSLVFEKWEDFQILDLLENES